MSLTHRCSAFVAMVIVLCCAIPAAAEEPPAAKKPIPGKAAAKPTSKARVLVTISKETTYVTGPLRKDGYVDYVAALNQRCSQGVTPDNNAAVLYWKAMGPDGIEKRHREQYFKMLGVPPLSEQGDYYVPFTKYVQGLQNAAKPRSGNTEQQVPDEILKEYNEATGRPWPKREFPRVAGWLTANERPLALLTEATKRPRRYDPSIGEDSGWMVAFLLPAIQSHREAARVFLARAMLRIGEGKVDAAWEDLLSCHRLARLVGQGPTLVEALVAIAIDGMACSGDEVLLRPSRLTAAQASKMRNDLGRLRPILKMADTMDSAERFMYLDLVSTAARNGLASLLEGLGGGGRPQMLKPLIDRAGGAAIDWNEPLRLGNTWYDRMTDACRKPTRAERKAAWVKIDEDIRKLHEVVKDVKSLALSMLTNPRQAVSRRIGEALVALLLSAVPKAADIEDRGAMQFELIRVAFALAAYRADHGSYPARLADLVPKYVAEAPKDLFVAAELHYQRLDKGYVLYSVGVNGKDDGAKGDAERRGGSEDWDDLVVRVPSPAGKQWSN